MDLRELPHATERRHPWERARLNYFSTMVDRCLPADKKDCRYLDVGAGDAWIASSLMSRHDAITKTVAWDVGYHDGAIRSKVAERAQSVELTASQPTGNFDLVTLLDVLEHVEEPESFLRKIVDNNVESNGRVLISVPAWSQLFSKHDIRLGHYRRYDPTTAKKLIEQSNLEIVSSGGLFHTLLVPRLAQVLQERLYRPREQTNNAMAWRHGKVLTNTIMAALGCDAALSHLFGRIGLDIPGLSWWALCQKRR